jgi:hypothetical protein
LCEGVTTRASTTFFNLYSRFADSWLMLGNSI